MKKNKIKSIPESFPGIKEASEFWDSHDAGDYPENLKELSEGIVLSHNMSETVLIENNLSRQLKKVAQKQGISFETLVNLWLEEKVQTSC